MICPGCAHEVKGPKFCELCGSSLAGLSRSADLLCPDCGQGNKSGNKFCESCGSSLAEFAQTADLICASCGQGNKNGSKFCESCGSSLAELSQSADLLCPACGQGNKSGSKFCESCGSSLVKFTQPAGLICPVCGSRNKKDTQFCRQCGKVFSAPEVQVSSAPVKSSLPTPKKRTGGRVFLGITGILLVVFVGLIAFGGGLRNRTSPSSADDYQTADNSQVAAVAQPTASAAPEEPNPPEAAQTEPESGDAGESADPAGEYILPPTAAYQPAAIPPRVVIWPFKVDPGSHQNIQLSNFTPGELITLDIINSLGNLENRSQLIADANGEETASLSLPEDAPFGLYWIGATGQISQYTAQANFYVNLQLVGNVQPPPDADDDGLWDETENWVAETYGPYYVLDENENRNLTGPLAFVFQVTPAPDYWGKGIILTVVGLWGKDYAPGIAFVHYGDTEAVEIWLELVNGDFNTGTYRLNQMTMFRHSNGYFYWPDDLEMIDNHPIVYTSEMKHGSYGSRQECEDSVYWAGFKEDCGEGREFYAQLPPEHNVGEVNLPLFNRTDEREYLGSLFPGERIWDQNYNFCGGYAVPDSERNGSRSYYVDLIVKKFESDKMPICAGALRGKWFPRPD